MIKINSVKYSETSDKVEIDYLEFNRASSAWDKKMLTSSETPAPEFAEAMRTMTNAAIILCELPRTWQETMQTEGFSLAESEAGRNLVIHSAQNLKSGARIIFDSPSRNIDADTEIENPEMNEIIRYVEDAIRAAKDYIEGCRFHAKLPDAKDDRIIDDVGNIAFTSKGLGFQAGLDGKGPGANPYEMVEQQTSFIAWENGRQEGEMIRAHFHAQM
ncbi:MAG: hypothetical protein LBV12_11980 [Puniceicoccales bacterium]|jgi:ribosome modulation factor|nr:hypothetical protein [Puniceicoccales bacterium]